MFGLGLAARRLIAPAKADTADARPTEGDHLVSIDAAEVVPLEPKDITESLVLAWPMEPAAKLVRDGSRLNKVLLVRIDPHWDYDRQRMIPRELEDQINENLKRQFRHGERVLEFYRACKLKYPFSLHLIGERATDSQFYVKRVEAS